MVSVARRTVLYSRRCCWVTTPNCSTLPTLRLLWSCCPAAAAALVGARRSALKTKKRVSNVYGSVVYQGPISKTKNRKQNEKFLCTARIEEPRRTGTGNQLMPGVYPWMARDVNYTWTYLPYAVDYITVVFFMVDAL